VQEVSGAISGRNALVALLAVNSGYLVAKCFFGGDTHVSTAWTIALVASYMIVTALMTFNARVPLIAVKVIIWLSFVYMVVMVVGDPEVPEPRSYGSSWQYLELAWAAIFCLGSLYSTGRLGGQNGRK